MICCIQTGQDPISVALINGAEIIWATTLKSTFHMTENIMTVIESGLNASDHSWKELSAVAVNKGPGSYTGLRIGVTTANTIAQTLDIPVYGFSSLELLVSSHAHHNSIALGLLKARKNEFNVALFSLKSLPVKRISDDVVLSAEALAKKLEEFEAPIHIIGDIDTLSGKNHHHSLISAYPTAETLGVMVQALTKEGLKQNHFPVHPIYPYGSI